MALTAVQNHSDPGPKNDNPSVLMNVMPHLPSRPRCWPRTGGLPEHQDCRIRWFLTWMPQGEKRAEVPFWIGHVDSRPDRAVVPFLNGAGPSTGGSERSSRMAGGFGAASGAGRGQHAAPGARSARTNGVEAVSWSTQDLLAGVVDSVRLC